MRYEVQQIVVGDSPMEVFFFHPADRESQRAGIILAQHIPVGHAGLEHDEFTLVAAERLAQAGYVVAVPFIFHWWPKAAPIETKAKESRDDWTLQDLKATFELLAADKQVDAERIAAVGHCWGGRVAWLAAASLPLAACAIFYGGRIKLGLGEGSPPAISRAADLQCPVAGFFGNDDRNPTPDDVDDYEQALLSAGIIPEFHRYDGAGHAFQNFPSEDRYRHEQSEDAWLKLIDFLSRTLD